MSHWDLSLTSSTSINQERLNHNERNIDIGEVFWPLDASGMASRRAFIQGKIDELRKELENGRRD